MPAFVLVTVVLALGLAACGDPTPPPPTPTPSSGPPPPATAPPASTSAPTVAATPSPAATPAATPAPPPASAAVTFDIGSVGEELKFDPASLSAASGATVTVRFNNGSQVQQHNWVLVQEGAKDDVATAGLGAGADNGWIPQGDSRVVAHTELLDPQATGEVAFTAPAPGTYRFVCTFPGHNITMFGDFVVTP